MKHYKTTHVLSVIALSGFLCATSQGALTVVDNFDSYSDGDSLESGLGGWAATFPGNGIGEVEVDPLNAGNLTGSTVNNAGNEMAIDHSITLPDGGTSTVFFRFLASSTDLIGEIGTATGSTSGNFGNWANYISLSGGDISFRNNGGNTSVGSFTANTWYNVWMVIDSNNPGNDTADLYITTGSGSATAGDLIANDFGSRNDGTVAQFTFQSRTPDTLFIDDVYFDASGANLANPIPEPSVSILVSLGALALLRRRR